MPASTKTIVDALKHRYASSKSPDSPTPGSEIVQFLRGPATNLFPKTPNLIKILSRSNPGWILSDEHKSILNSVDDCSALIFNLMNVEPVIEQKLKIIIPELACQFLEDPLQPLTPMKHSLLALLDLLVSACIGWTPDLGRSGDQFIKQVDLVINSIVKNQGDYKEVTANLRSFLEKEKKRTVKLEERLIASETGILRSKKSKLLTAQMINQEMENKLLTASIVKFLQGPWNDSIQLLALNEGFESEQWFRAVKMTETIIRTYQPISLDDKDEVNAEKQRLYRIIEHIPNEIRDLLVALEHNSESAQSALAEIENEHVLVISEEELDYVPFSPIDIDGEAIDKKTSVSRVLLRKLNALEPGQWFTFEESEQSIRIKLILKIEDIKTVLFTNRNGMKALEKSFDELAYYLSSGVIRPLNLEKAFSTTFSHYYQGLIDHFVRDLAQEAEADREQASLIAARDRQLEEAASEARKAEDALRTRRQEARETLLTLAKNEALAVDRKEEVLAVNKSVNMMSVGTWLKLPGIAGDKEECKLAVRLAGVDKMIFVNREGMKVGDFSTEQLTHLLVTDRAEIIDEGIEFEDTLAEVVTKLRQDRNKSYDELTGK